PSGSTKCMRQAHITRGEVYRDLWRVSISSEYRKVVGRLSGRYGLLSEVRSKRTSCYGAQTPRRETTINVITDESNSNGHEWQMDRLKEMRKRCRDLELFQFKVMQIRCSADGQGLAINEQGHREPGNLRAFHLIEYCRLSCCCRSCVADASPSSPMYFCTFLSLATDSSPGSSGNKRDGERELHRYVTDYLTVDGRQP
ncbi:hypothetical protein ALC56_14405, partial [Trachymyrmex septentrionalis]